MTARVTGLERVSPTPVLLAAGVGSRLGGCVKALFPVDGGRLLDHCVETLGLVGFRRLRVVTGPAADALQSYAGSRPYPIALEYIHNKWYSELNNFYTLRVACAAADGPLLVMNSDIIFAREIVEAVLHTGGAMRLAIEPGTTDPEALKARLTGRLVKDLGKHLNPGAAYGEFIGISFMSDEVRRRYIGSADEALVRGETDLYYEDIYARLCRDVEAVAVDVAAGSWAEIDCVADVPAAAAVAARKSGGAAA